MWRSGWPGSLSSPGGESGRLNRSTGSAVVSGYTATGGWGRSGDGGCRSWRPSSRPSRCMSRATARPSGAWGRASGSCGFRRGEPPRLLTPMALAIAGAFEVVGERKRENLPSESRIMRFPVPERLSSAVFEATHVFATAKMGGGSIVRCNHLRGAVFRGLPLKLVRSDLWDQGNFAILVKNRL